MSVPGIEERSLLARGAMQITAGGSAGKSRGGIQLCCVALGLHPVPVGAPVGTGLPPHVNPNKQTYCIDLQTHARYIYSPAYTIVAIPRITTPSYTWHSFLPQLAQGMLTGEAVPQLQGGLVGRFSCE